MIAIGRGQSDRRAGEMIRQESSRFAYPKTLKGRQRRWKDGSTIRDWMELFAEPIYETRRPRAWPRVVAFDEVPFKIGVDWESDSPAGRSVFHVFGCYGWNKLHEPGQVVALRAMPRFEFNQGTRTGSSTSALWTSSSTGDPGRSSATTTGRSCAR